jgi:hypothetical protein
MAREISWLPDLEEIIRGRLNAIRQAEAGKGRISIEQASSMPSDRGRQGSKCDAEQ